LTAGRLSGKEKNKFLCDLCVSAVKIIFPDAFVSIPLNMRNDSGKRQTDNGSNEKDSKLIHFRIPICVDLDGFDFFTNRMDTNMRSEFASIPGFSA
jgi:hypothetical protein